VREAARRERRAIESARAFAKRGSAASAAIDAMLAQLPSDADANRRLWTYYLSAVQAYGGPDAIAPGVRGGVPSRGAGTPPTRSLVPVMTDSVKVFLEARGKVDRPRTLHPLMQYEALNFADGNRTVEEIYNAVAAEADSAGTWYYGTVELADVEKLFESAGKAGLVKLNERGKVEGSPRR
jgi:hypothetical protein